MNAAIIFLKNEFEANLAKAKYLDTNLLSDLIEKLKQVSLDKLYLVGSEVNDNKVECIDNVNDIVTKIYGHDGRTILLSPFYPEIKTYHLEALLKEDGEGVALSDGEDIIEVFKLENKDLVNYGSVSYRPFVIEQSSTRKINDFVELQEYAKEERIRINTNHLKNGVNILDVEDTYISRKTEIEPGATIYPNVYMDGHCVIKKNSTITNGSYLIDAEIGENTTITSSRIDSSIVHNNVTIGPMAHLRGHSEVFDNVRIGNFVEFKNTKFNKGSKCAHLTYLGDSIVGENVNIGCGVVTVNYDGAHKFATIIKDHAFIGSNANLIAPITVGQYAVVAAGSTVTDNVPDDDMAIARARQLNKQGYGYKYIKKEK